MHAVADQPLFDAHLHYNATDIKQYSPDRIVSILKHNNVHRAVVTSYPPEQAMLLYEADPQQIIPILGVYQSVEDKLAWINDNTLPAKVEQMLAQGPWRGVGELHVFAEHRRSPVLLNIVEITTKRGIPLLMHCDPAVIDSIFEHSPGARVIWAHAGAYPYPQLLRDYLQRYPHLYVDLSVRDDLLAPGGKLDAEWENLLWEFPDRFLTGVDTFSAERWGEYHVIAARIRNWLAQLPQDVSAKVAYRNAESVFSSVP
jgi:predicted TIM-barrel fold metal-dependent hydrolase